MATINTGYTWVSGNVVTPTLLNQMVNSASVSGIVNADIGAGAAIAHSKLATTTSGQVLMGNASNVTTATPISGDITLSAAGVATIAVGAVEATMLSGAQSGAAPIFGVRAWVNFNGSAVTNVGGEDRCTIRASGNVAKVVRNGTGSYSVFYTTAIQADACASGSAHDTTSTGSPNVNQWVSAHAISTTQCNVFVQDVTNVGQNVDVVSLMVVA
jgi:hypothetical protein